MHPLLVYILAAVGIWGRAVLLRFGVSEAIALGVQVVGGLMSMATAYGNWKSLEIAEEDLRLKREKEKREHEKEKREQEECLKSAELVQVVLSDGERLLFFKDDLDKKYKEMEDFVKEVERARVNASVLGVKVEVGGVEYSCASIEVLKKASSIIFKKKENLDVESRQD